MVFLGVFLGVFVALLLFGFVGGLAGAIVGGGRRTEVERKTVRTPRRHQATEPSDIEDKQRSEKE